mmetsp:Transcript_6339/g.15778  ORF Transcript_6339/g.15778 Transcript_6339/m.15778 type:complete len:975 (+) Transcript_6339:221-3145(+)
MARTLERGQTLGLSKPSDSEPNDVQDLILSCNKDGMESLRKAKDCRHDPQLKAAFEQFKYAEAILLANQAEQDNTALLAVTCNNLGCYYKKVGKFHGALSYLRRALRMEIELKTDEVTVASTHLNICAVLSKLEKHDKAVQHALSALDLMSKRVTHSETGVSEDDYAVLAVAYHSVGKEREFFEQWDQAALAFQSGYQVAKRLLGEQHPLTQTLARNCEAVLQNQKSTGRAKVKTKQRLDRMDLGKDQPGGTDGGQGGGGGDRGLSLPPLPGASDKVSEADTASMPDKSNKVRNAAADWIKSEEALWVNFANKALNTGSASQHGTTTLGQPLSPSGSATRDLGQSEAGDSHDNGDDDPMALMPLRPAPLATAALLELQDTSFNMPKAYDMGAFRFESLSPKALVKKTAFGQAMDKHPEALMDIMDADGDGPSSKIQDFRPNRVMKRQTRTSRVVRRSGVFNSMTHRDRVEQDLTKRRLGPVSGAKSVETQRLAAEKIQRVWRAWFQYCQENSEWMTITWICATMIQSHWRSYHVRRQRVDYHANNVQRHIRGFLVRSALRRHTAAVTIQRRVVGMITRKKLQHLHDSATHIQRLVRGGLARRRFRELHRVKTQIVIIIQRYIRQFMAKREMKRKHADEMHRRMLLKACIDLQRLFRGWKGRNRAQQRREEYLQTKREYDAANLLQNHVRGRQARKRVDIMRAQRMAEMEKAATFLRKVWIGSRTKKKYRQLQEEFKAAEDKIITIQRYVRGCMCRLKMWREAVQTEEELWAAIEIQRTWRGYMGRVRWEHHFEDVWRREMAAAMIQRNIRGWLVRVKVQRRRRKVAREEFQKARARFRAAQRIQALARGVLNRKRTRVRLARCTHAATHIQKIARGRAVRKALWEQVIGQRATLVTALARGFIVRRRRRRLVAKVIRIQRAYRRWRNRPLTDRQGRRQQMLDRQAKARIIQRQFRQLIEHKTLQKINATAIVAK